MLARWLFNPLPFSWKTGGVKSRCVALAVAVGCIFWLTVLWRTWMPEAPIAQRSFPEAAAVSTDPIETEAVFGATSEAPLVLPPIEAVAAMAEQSATASDSLVLTTTVVGVSHRAAMINSRLYTEGAAIRVDGEVYRLIQVRPGEAVLQNQHETIRLSIAP